MKRINNVTPERLKDMLSYDRDTGIFVWKAKGRGIRHGKRAGSLDSGYRYIVVDGAAYLAQRLAWLFVYGEWPKNVLRFLNDDTDDCRIDNLKDSDFTKEAKAESDKKYREKNWDRLQQYDRARNFGISLKEYGDMLLAQNGCCAICKQPETATRNGRVKALAVDHDHETGEIRSLLCVQCNTGLGKFKDDRNLLLSAIKYLDHHKGVERVSAKLEVVRNN